MPGAFQVERCACSVSRHPRPMLCLARAVGVASEEIQLMVIKPPLRTSMSDVVFLHE